jgi:hypothetical protein
MGIKCLTSKSIYQSLDECAASLTKIADKPNSAVIASNNLNGSFGSDKSISKFAHLTPFPCISSCKFVAQLSLEPQWVKNISAPSIANLRHIAVPIPLL